MMFAYTIDNWQEKVLPELLRVLKPGGYLELMENDIIWYEEGPLSHEFREQGELRKWGGMWCILQKLSNSFKREEGADIL